MDAHGVRDDRLDDVAVGAGQPDRRRPQPGVPVPHRGDGPVLGVTQRLAAGAGEDHRAGMVLDGPPQRVGGQHLRLLAGPVAVVALPQPVVERDGVPLPRARASLGAGTGARPGPAGVTVLTVLCAFALARGGRPLPRDDRLGGFPAALQRAGDDGGERDGRQPPGQRAGLRPASVVEADTRRPAEQDGAGHRGQPVAYEQNGGHRGCPTVPRTTIPTAIFAAACMTICTMPTRETLCCRDEFPEPAPGTWFPG